MQLKPGTLLLKGGKYKIERVLGQGGFGITYLATQELLDRKVCIKEFFFKDSCSRKRSGEVELGTIGNRDLVERFLNKFIKEARTISQLDHPNIIRILDIFKENNTAYYVMDFIEGSSLDDIVDKRGALPEKEAVDYIKQVASALDYIHQRSINHLDIKPANIMVRNDNKAILIDFGVSKQYDEQGEQTSTTPVGISYGYAPLEQYRPGGVSEFSPQADIYSLGATLYRLLTGKIPPQAMEILNEGLPNTIDKFSSHVKDAIKQSMQMRKVDRPDSINAFMHFFPDGDKQYAKPQSTVSQILYTDKESENLAQIFYEKAIEIDEDKDAFPFYLKAANLGHVQSQLSVGEAYHYGLFGVEKDEKKAFEWYKKAAESGNVEALNELAFCYDCGIGIKEDKVKAFEIYHKAFVLNLHNAENGDKQAMSNVTYYYRNGLGVSKDPEKVFEWTKKCADDDNVDDIAYLSFCYETGYGTEQDVNKASELYEKVIEMSNAEELFDIGSDFVWSDDEKENEQAHKWFEKAAEKGDVDIIKKIANEYYCCVNEAIKYYVIEYYEKAVALGDVESMVRLGYYYMRQGTEKNYAKAIKWFEKAINSGKIDELKDDGLCNERRISETIALMYSMGGYGINKDETKASQWRLRAKCVTSKLNGNNEDTISL